MIFWGGSYPGPRIGLETEEYVSIPFKSEVLSLPRYSVNLMFFSETAFQMESRIISSGIRERLMKAASGFSMRRNRSEISFSAI